MEQRFNSFDQQVKQAYEGHELPYDPDSWDKLSSELDKAAPASSSYFAALTAGVAAVGLVFLSLLFILYGNNDPADTVQETEQVKGEQPHEQITASSEESAGYAEEADGTTSDTPEGEGKEGFRADETSADYADANTAASAASETSSTALQKEDVPGSASPTDPSVRGVADESNETVEGDSENDMISSSDVIRGSESLNRKTVRTSCTGATIQFDAAQDYGEDAKYLWNFGDGFFSNEARPSHTFNKSGTFDVSLSVTSPASGQITSNVVQAMIRVLEGPRARMGAYPTSPNTVEIENLSSGENRTEWLISGTAAEKDGSVVLDFVPGTSQKIRLTASDKAGCADTLSKVVRFAQTQKAVTFTPDKPLDFSAVLEETPSRVHIFDAVSGEHAADIEGTVWHAPEEARGQKYVFMAVSKGKGSPIVIRGDLTGKP